MFLRHNRCLLAHPELKFEEQYVHKNNKPKIIAQLRTHLVMLTMFSPRL
jgi:hypothetical protein